MFQMCKNIAKIYIYIVLFVTMNTSVIFNHMCVIGSDKISS